MPPLKGEVARRAGGVLRYNPSVSAAPSQLPFQGSLSFPISIFVQIIL